MEERLASKIKVRDSKALWVRARSQVLNCRIGIADFLLTGREIVGKLLNLFVGKFLHLRSGNDDDNRCISQRVLRIRTWYMESAYNVESIPGQLLLNLKLY